MEERLAIQHTRYKNALLAISPKQKSTAILKDIVNSFISLVYPPICIHCDAPLSDPSSLFCNSCGELITLLNHENRCPRCFSSDYSIATKRCRNCYENGIIFHGCASALEYIGPATTLVKNLKYSSQPYLADGAGAYMAAQFLSLDWPIPDIIVPVPLSLTHKFQRGYNQAYLLAKAFSSIIPCHICNTLTRRCDSYSQTNLSQQQRKVMGSHDIIVKKGSLITDKTILIIDDVTTTGTTLRRCAEAIAEYYPRKIYALTLCHAA